MTSPPASSWRRPPDRPAQRYNLAESTVRSLRMRDLLDLARAEPGFDDLSLDYGDPAGTRSLREAIATNTAIAPDQVMTTPGTMLGLFLLASVTAAEGHALVITPCFGPMRDALHRAGMAMRFTRLRFEESYHTDVARIAAALRPDTRLVCLADPQNPSGVRVPRPALLALLAALAERAPQAQLFLDETYREATHGGAAPPSAANLDPRIITCGSLSKAHGAPGLRIGWLTIPDPRLRARVIAAKEQLIIAGSTLDETLAALLLRRAGTHLAERRQALATAFGAVLRWQAPAAELLEMVRPEAGALCCLRLHPRHVKAAGVTRFWNALPEQNLRLAPGPWFGESRRVFRLGFGHLPADELEQALPALSRALDAAF